MGHPLKSFARAVQDATSMTYMQALAFVQANIEKIREDTRDITDRQIRTSTVIARLVERAQTAPAGRRTRPVAEPLTPEQLREELENDTPEAAGYRDDKE